MGVLQYMFGCMLQCVSQYPQPQGLYPRRWWVCCIMCCSARCSGCRNQWYRWWCSVCCSVCCSTSCNACYSVWSCVCYSVYSRVRCSALQRVGANRLICNTLHSRLGHMRTCLPGAMILTMKIADSIHSVYIEWLLYVCTMSRTHIRTITNYIHTKTISTQCTTHSCVYRDVYIRPMTRTVMIDKLT